MYEQKWFHVRADSCLLPDGRTMEPYFVVEVPNWCNMVAVTEDEKMILVRQYRYPVDATTYELPGGVIEEGEAPEKAALREMEEETGYTSNDVEYLFEVRPNPAINNNTAYFYLARNAVKTTSLNLDPYEDLDVLLFTKEEMRTLLAENKLQHGVQLGAVYEAMLRLGWLKYE